MSELLPPERSLLALLVTHRRDPLAYITRAVREDDGVSVLRLGSQQIVLVAEPELVHDVLVRRTGEFRKAHGFERGLPWAAAILGDGLLMSDGDVWLRHRRMMQPAFHRAEVARYGSIMTNETARTLETWSTGLRDVYRDMSQLTLRAISRAIFGIGGAVEELHEGFRDLFEDRQAARGIAYLIPEWVPTPANLRTRRGLRTVDRLIGEAIRVRRAQRDRPHDLLTTLIEARDESGTPFTDRQVRDEIMSTTVAGQDTLAATLTFTLDMLARDQEIQARLAEEIERVLSGRTPTADDRSALGYLDQVVQEVLRLFPPGRNIVRVAVIDTELAGRSVRKGASIILSEWAVHRDPRWYEDPEVFRPERWSTEFEAQLPRAASFPFGAGPRLCLGAPFAELMLRLSVALIVQRFVLSPHPDPRMSTWDPATLRPRRGLRLLLRHRSN